MHTSLKCNRIHKMKQYSSLPLMENFSLDPIPMGSPCQCESHYHIQSHCITDKICQTPIAYHCWRWIKPLKSGHALWDWWFLNNENHYSNLLANIYSTNWESTTWQTISNASVVPVGMWPINLRVDKYYLASRSALKQCIKCLYSLQNDSM